MDKKHILIIFLLVSVLLYSFPANSYAGMSEAGDYLESVQNTDGSWGTDPDTIFFETTEVLNTLRMLGWTGFAYEKGINFISGESIAGTEDRSRKVLSLFPAGKDVTNEINSLQSTQNSDGGWGFDSEYASDIYHAALALSALNTVGIVNPTLIANAKNYIASQQYADGAFGLSDSSKSVYLTALIVETLKRLSSASSIIDPAVSWLLTQQNPDGGFGQPSSNIFETSHAMMALYNHDLTNQAVLDALGYLESHQELNGSFADDIYLTAVAAQGLDTAIVETDLYQGLALFGYQTEVPPGYTSYNLLADLGGETEVDKIQKYNPATGAFETTLYQSGVPAGDMFDIVTGEGYFVYMKTPKSSSQAGNIVKLSVQLTPGLNIVAIPCDPAGHKSYDMLSYIGTPDEVTSIQKFDKETGTFQTTTYYNSQPSGVNFDVENGEAYLVYMKVAKTVDFPVGNVVVDYEINKGGSVNDSRKFQGDSAVLDQAAYYTQTITGIPDFITYTTTRVTRISDTEMQVYFSIYVSDTAPEGIYEFQVEYGLSDSSSNPLGPLSNNIFSFKIKVIPRVVIYYEINKGGSVSDSRNFQGDSAVLDQVVFYTQTITGIPDFITYTRTGLSRVSATAYEVSFSIQVSDTAPEGIYEFQVEYALLDLNFNPLGPLSNNIFSFKIQVIP